MWLRKIAHPTRHSPGTRVQDDAVIDVVTLVKGTEMEAEVGGASILALSSIATVKPRVLVEARTSLEVTV